MLTQEFHIGNQMPGGVVDQARVRFAAATAALIKEDNAIDVGIEKASCAIVASSARSAMHKHDWLAFGIPAFFEVEFVFGGYS
jgi:hypothetical protein